MRRKGVLYDVGRVLWVNWRPVFDPAVVRRELQIIREDLHCNAVKICGRDIGRLTVAAKTALELDLEVWFSPGPGVALRGVRRVLPQLVAAACQVGGLGGVARQLDGSVVRRARVLTAAQPA